MCRKLFYFQYVEHFCFGQPFIVRAIHKLLLDEKHHYARQLCTAVRFRRIAVFSFMLCHYFFMCLGLVQSARYDRFQR